MRSDPCLGVAPPAGTARTVLDRLGTDPLSDLLRVVRLDGAHFLPVEVAEPFSVEVAAAKEFLPRGLSGSEHLIPYHILTEGRCFVGPIGEEQVELGPGDVVVFPQDDPHVIASQPQLRPGPGVHTAAWIRQPETAAPGGPGRKTASFICGFLGCDRRPFNPLLAALPRMMHMRSLLSTGPGAFTRQAIEEARLGRAGASCILTRLAELMFIEVVRRYLNALPEGQTGWLAGLRDDLVGRVLSLLHGRPSHPWTLAELAREVGSSRSNVTKRFTALLGQPPIQYLTWWRMQVAANVLCQSGAKVASVGVRVGYHSEAAFSRAFKKVTGYAPGAWRAIRQPAR